MHDVRDPLQELRREGRGDFLCDNYAGDLMNFDLGAERAEADGVEIQSVLIADDAASAPADRKHELRGIAGLIPIVTLVGPASQTATSLDQLADTARHACLQTRSISPAEPVDTFAEERTTATVAWPAESVMDKMGVPKAERRRSVVERCVA